MVLVSPPCFPDVADVSTHMYPLGPCNRIFAGIACESRVKSYLPAGNSVPFQTTSLVNVNCPLNAGAAWTRLGIAKNVTNPRTAMATMCVICFFMVGLLPTCLVNLHPMGKHPADQTGNVASGWPVY